MRLPKPLDFYFANRFAHPFGSTRFGRTQEYLGGWLRQHCLGILAIASFHLASTLESEDDRILRLAILCDGGVKLRKALQAGQFVDHEPNWLLVRHWFVQE